MWGYTIIDHFHDWVWFTTINIYSFHSLILILEQSPHYFHPMPLYAYILEQFRHLPYLRFMFEFCSNLSNENKKLYLWILIIITNIIINVRCMKVINFNFFSHLMYIYVKKNIKFQRVFFFVVVFSKIDIWRGLVFICML